MNNASIFISKRKNSITENRIKNIFWYIIECYQKLVDDGVRYSKKYVSKNTTMKFEDFLKNRLVDDYLVENKNLLKQKTSLLDEINFVYEVQKEYIDLKDGKRKPDKIDVFINKLGLSNLWEGECDENIYLAIECKRISKNGDIHSYIGDICKFANRSYLKLRLPVEGQLAFIESDINSKDIANNINIGLSNHDSIITNLELSPCILNDRFTQGTYLSKHQRNATKSEFSIYHLLLDYSSIVEA